MFSKPSKLFCVILFICLGITVAVGCGKKGPPLPPLKQGHILAPVSDLKYTRDDNNLVLSWTHTADTRNANVKPEGFEVFLAKKALDGCEGCPFILARFCKIRRPFAHRCLLYH